MPIEFSSEVKWRKIGSPKKGESAGTKYEAKVGTVAELLDEFETQVHRGLTIATTTATPPPPCHAMPPLPPRPQVMRKFPHHRFTIQRQKEMDGQFSRNRGPGVVQSDIDFMMDGTIPPPDGRSIQSDHWVPMSWTGFIQVSPSAYSNWLPLAAPPLTNLRRCHFAGGLVALLGSMEEPKQRLGGWNGRNGRAC